MDERSCTDMLCLLLFIFVAIGTMIVGIVAMATGNIDQIKYPSDYNGRYCGKSGTDLADLPYAYYPRLDQDILDQYSVLSVGYWWKFVPYTLCVAECPSAFSFSDNTPYGGCAYPQANCTDPAALESSDAPLFYSGFQHTTLLKRCFPIFETGHGGDRELCSLPNCTDAGKACVNVPADPSVTSVWQIEDDADRDSCDRIVSEVTSVVFKPDGQDDDSYEKTREFADYVSEIYGFTKALEDAIGPMVVFGVVGPLLGGFLWVGLLWLFAGVIVWFALALTVILLLVMTILCYIKAGLAPNLTNALGLDGSDRNVSIYDAAISTETQEELFDSLAPSENTDAYTALAIIMTILLIFVVVMLIIWRNCIVRCIAIVKESCKVFKTIPMLVAWPLVTITALSLVCTWGIAVPMYIFYGDVETYYENYQEVVDAVEEAASGGETGSEVSDYLSNPQAMQWVLFGIHAFGVIWFIEFIKACAWITMSGSVAYWCDARLDLPARPSHRTHAPPESAVYGPPSFKLPLSLHAHPPQNKTHNTHRTGTTRLARLQVLLP